MYVCLDLALFCMYCCS